MSDITKIKTYILFFDPQKLKHHKFDSINIQQVSDLTEEGKAQNYLFYQFGETANGGLSINKLNNDDNIKFEEFRERILENIKFNEILGYGYSLSDLDDKNQFIELHHFNKDIIENNECDDIWMNLIIISPIALFLTDNIKFARGEFIGANDTIKPTAFLLKYPKNGSPDNDIEKIILDSQFELEKYPIFRQYSYLQVKPFITDYVNKLVSIIKDARARCILKSTIKED